VLDDAVPAPGRYQLDIAYSNASFQGTPGAPVGALAFHKRLILRLRYSQELGSRVRGNDGFAFCGRLHRQLKAATKIFAAYESTRRSRAGGNPY
jgi:hypothetical protein